MTCFQPDWFSVHDNLEEGLSQDRLCLRPQTLQGCRSGPVVSRKQRGGEPREAGNGEVVRKT